MAVRYDNDKNQLLINLETEQGASFFPSKIYVHTDKKGFKRLYILNKMHRTFMFFEDPKFSVLGQYFGTFMLGVIVFNLIVFIISSMDQFKVSPETCLQPACNDDAKLCPGIMICEPEAMKWTGTVELICVVIFTLEYLARLSLVWSVPPRLSDILVRPKRSELSMSTIFTSHEPSKKDELFAHIKLSLTESEAEQAALMRQVRHKSVIYDTPMIDIIDDEVDNMYDTNLGLGVDTDGQVSVYGDDECDEYFEGGDQVKLPLTRIKTSQTKDGMYDGGDFEDGYQLANMNVPVHSLGFSSLTDQPSREPTVAKISKKNGRRRRSNHHFQTNDGIKDLDRKSRSMDKSHRYTWYFKIFAYAKKTLNLIDVLAILPFFIETFVDANSSTSLSIIRVMRLARVFRIFKMGKGNAGVQMLGKTVYVSMPALSLLGFFIVLGVILFGALVFFIEQGDFTVTEEYPNGAYLISGFFGDMIQTAYTSIVSSIYWAVVVTTTTGYGDLVPTSFAGKLIAVVCAYYGVLLLALPITVIGNNFDKILNAQEGRDNEQFVCECLTGIVKSLDVEYRARSRLAVVPSNAYKTTLIAAIISTFDATKQTLIKDAILNANRELNEKRWQNRADEKSKRKESIDADRVNATAHETVQSKDSMESTTLVSLTKAGQSPGKMAIAKTDMTFQSGKQTYVGSPRGSIAPAVNPLKSTIEVKMTGIVWQRMPKMPEGQEEKQIESRKGQTPQEELKLAKLELDEALAEWTNAL